LAARLVNNHEEETTASLCAVRRGPAPAWLGAALAGNLVQVVATATVAHPVHRSMAEKHKGPQRGDSIRSPWAYQSVRCPDPTSQGIY